MRFHRLALAATLLLVASACGGLKTSYDFDPSANFAGFQAWDFIESAPNPQLDQLSVQRLENSIVRTLASKGMERVDVADVRQGDGIQFAVGYQVILDEEVSYNTVNTGYGGGWGYGGWYGPGYGGMGVSTSRTYENRVQVGTLIIDIFDVESRELVWRGTGESEIHEIPDPQERQARLNEVVDKIMQDFPPSMN